MADIQELKALVETLQETVDATQAQVETLLSEKEATIVSLQEQIAKLQALVDASPTPEQLQEVVDSLTATKADIEQTLS